MDLNCVKDYAPDGWGRLSHKKYYLTISSDYALCGAPTKMALYMHNIMARKEEIMNEKEYDWLKVRGSSLSRRGGGRSQGPAHGYRGRGG